MDNWRICRIIPATRGGYVVETEGEQFPLQPVEPELEDFVGLPYDLPVTISNGNAEINPAALPSARPALLAHWEHIKSELPDDVSLAINPVVETLPRRPAAARPQAFHEVSGPVQDANAALGNIRVEIGRAICRNSLSEAQHDRLLDLFDETTALGQALNRRHNGVVRALPVYTDPIDLPLPGARDIHPPSDYDAIRYNAHAICGFPISHYPENINGSGIRVAEDLILTAGHIDGSRNGTIVFGHESPPTTKKGSPVQRIVVGPFRRLYNGIHANPRLDFQILEFDPQDLPLETWPALQMDLRIRKRGEPVYAVGHPRLEDETNSNSGNYPKRVHDDAFVLFPSEVEQAEYCKLRAAIERELQGVADADDYRDAFYEFYREVLGASQGPWRYSRPKTGNIFGINTDTFTGNSGGGVFDRRNHQLIGVFVGGERDFSLDRGQVEVYDPGWRYHEKAVPCAAIVEHLREHMPELLDRLDLVV